MFVTFKKDSTYNSTEQLKGQTSEYIKEDWKFINSGIWRMKGDTIMLNVQREKCVKQVYWNYLVKNGKAQWVKNVAPTYDSTYTDGKKDRFMTFEYVKDYFKRTK